MSGNSSKSFLRSVDFPVPEGPEMTIGREEVGAMVKGARRAEVDENVRYTEVTSLTRPRWGIQDREPAKANKVTSTS